MLTPVIILIRNQTTGRDITECNKIAIDAKEAKAANTLICPTFCKKLGIINEPNRNPM